MRATLVVLVCHEVALAAGAYWFGVLVLPFCHALPPPQEFSGGRRGCCRSASSCADRHSRRYYLCCQRNDIVLSVLTEQTISMRREEESAATPFSAFHPSRFGLELHSSLDACEVFDTRNTAHLSGMYGVILVCTAVAGGPCKPVRDAHSTTWLEN